MNYMQQPMQNPKDISDLTTAMNMALVLMAKAFNLNYTKPTNNNQIISSNLATDRLHGRNAGNQNGYNAVQNAGNQVGQNAVQNPVARVEEEQYTELLESTIDTHLVQQDDSNVIPVDSSMNPSEGEEFLKKAAKFVRDFKSFAKEADESLEKIKVLEKENKHLLRAVVSQDIVSIMQNHSVVDTSNLQTELERTKEKL
ncbi:hypothetical protein Tco_0528632 [Tanacetum coccineum]